MTAHGLCECGCGAAAPIAQKTDTRKGCVKGQPRRFIPGHNRRKYPMCGADHPRWNGGRRMLSGYIYVLLPNHPNADSTGYVGEHVLHAAQALGKRVPGGAVVHHVDGDRARNVNSNLVLCQDQAYHMILERRTRSLDACGNANWLVCMYCTNQDDPSNMHIRKTGGAYHNSCAAAYNRRRRRMRKGAAAA